MYTALCIYDVTLLQFEESTTSWFCSRVQILANYALHWTSCICALAIDLIQQTRSIAFNYMQSLVISMCEWRVKNQTCIFKEYGSSIAKVILSNMECSNSTHYIIRLATLFTLTTNL